MSVTVYTCDKPTNLSASLTSGGSLSPNTTYYVRIDASISPATLITGDLPYWANDNRFWNLISPPSDEYSFSTDSTNLSADLTWTAPIGATNYKVYMSKVSGQYSGNAHCWWYLWDAGLLTNAYSITTEPPCYTGAGYSWYNRVWILKSEAETSWKNYLNAYGWDTTGMFFGLNKEPGRPLVKIEGTVTFKDIYDAMVSAGLTDHCYYDGYNFAILGCIVSPQSGTAATLVGNNKHLWFFEGTLEASNASTVFTLGGYNEVIKCFENPVHLTLGLVYWHSSSSWSNHSLDLHGFVHGLDPTGYTSLGIINLKTQYLDFRGTIFDSFQGFQPYYNFPKLEGFTLYRGGVSTENIAGMDGITIYGARLGATSSAPTAFPPIKNVTVYQDPAYTGYSQDDIQVSSYGSEFNHLKFYNFNCLRTNNIPEIYWYCPTYGADVAMYVEMNTTILDKDKNPIEGAIIELIDKDGTKISTVSDSDGINDDEIWALLRLGVSSINPNGPCNGHGSTWTTFSPFTLTVSKSGYKMYISTFDLTSKKELVITLHKVLVTNLSRHNRIHWQ